MNIEKFLWFLEHVCWNHAFYRYFTSWPIWCLKISRGVPSLPRSAVSYINVLRKVGGRRVSGWRPAKLNLKVRAYPYTRQSSPRSCREVANHHLATFTTLDSPRLQSFQARLRYGTQGASSRAPFIFPLFLSSSSLDSGYYGAFRESDPWPFSRARCLLKRNNVAPLRSTARASNVQLVNYPPAGTNELMIIGTRGKKGRSPADSRRALWWYISSSLLPKINTRKCTGTIFCA